MSNVKCVNVRILRCGGTKLGTRLGTTFGVTEIMGGTTFGVTWGGFTGAVAQRKKRELKQAMMSKTKICRIKNITLASNQIY